MTPQDFTSWLKGFIEAMPYFMPDSNEWSRIVEVLKTVKPAISALSSDDKFEKKMWTSNNTLETKSEEQKKTLLNG